MDRGWSVISDAFLYLKNCKFCVFVDCSRFAVKSLLAGIGCIDDKFSCLEFLQVVERELGDLFVI